MWRSTHTITTITEIKGTQIKTSAGSGIFWSYFFFEHYVTPDEVFKEMLTK